MQTVTTIGFDIAKSVFQVHGVDAGGHPPPVEASPRPGVLSEAAAMPGWHRGLRLVAPLVARTSGDRSYRSADAAGLREALCQTAEERYGRRRGDLRGGYPSQHAFRANKDA